MMDGMVMTGMMTWGLSSMLLGLVILFLFILAVAYGVKWVWGERSPSTTAHGESALDLLRSDMPKAKSATKNLSGPKRNSNN